MHHLLLCVYIYICKCGISMCFIYFAYQHAQCLIIQLDITILSPLYPLNPIIYMCWCWKRWTPPYLHHSMYIYNIYIYSIISHWTYTPYCSVSKTIVNHPQLTIRIGGIFHRIMGGLWHCSIRGWWHYLLKIWVGYPFTNLVGWNDLPLWKIWRIVSWGDEIPNWMEP